MFNFFLDHMVLVTPPPPPPPQTQKQRERKRERGERREGSEKRML